MTCWIPFLPLGGPGSVVAAGTLGGFAVLAIRLMSHSQAHWWDRLFLYSGGIAQFAGRQAEPAVLRWADLAEISVQVVTGYEGDALTQCELRDSAGTTMTVSVNRYGDACEKAIAVAGRLLAGRLAGTLIARFDAGEMLTFGDLSVDRVGIRVQRGGKAAALWFAWRDTRAIDMTFYAHRLTITPRKGPARNVKLNGAPNDILAWYVLAHAAARAGVTVTGAPPELGQAAPA
jgi:hypothetical protein